MMIFRIGLTILLINLVSLSRAATEAQEKQHEQNINDCMKQFPKITDEIVKKIDSEDFDTEDKDIQCFAKCVAEKNGVVDDKGVIMIEKVMELHKNVPNMDKVKAAHEKCVEVTGADACETVWKQWRCMGDEVGWDH